MGDSAARARLQSLSKEQGSTFSALSEERWPRQAVIEAMLRPTLGGMWGLGRAGDPRDLSHSSSELRPGREEVGAAAEPSRMCSQM